jgi:type IV pilus assembly protein PilA
MRGAYPVDAVRVARPRRHLESESGFTLIELLIVILIIGVLAAIALPAFLGQKEKGEDGEAKSNARNLVSQVESCFAAEQTYVNCQTAAQLGDTGLDLGAGAGQVAVTAATANSFTVKAVSKANSGGQHEFTIAKSTSGATTRTCTPAGKGGCKNTGTW